MNSSKPAMPQRIAAIDAYRGFVMFLMMAEVLHLREVASAVPRTSAWSYIWSFLANHQSHVEWAGCTLHDLIQPSFSFLVGVALPFSIASRLSRGQSRRGMIWHAAWRALLLVLLGVFLRSVGRKLTYWTFEDTLSQIGLGYVPLFLLGLTTLGPRSLASTSEDLREATGAAAPEIATSRPPAGTGSLKWCWLALLALLVGYWAAFVLYPLPDPDFKYAKVGVPDDWPYLYSGFAAHWNKNSNLAWAFDTWFLNLFPRETPFAYNSGGYATLSFIPTLATMVMGLIAGERLRRDSQLEEVTRRQRQVTDLVGPGGLPIVRESPVDSQRFAWITVGVFVGVGIASLRFGAALDWLAICPSVKRIWTPAWVLYSGGWCLILLAGFYAILDGFGRTAWAFPLKVIGANSIAAYCIAHVCGGFIKSALRTNLRPGAFTCLGPEYEPLLMGIAVLIVYWLILLWMYWRRIFIRI